MNWSRAIRVWILSAMVTAICAVVTLAGWLLWPAVYEYWTVRHLIEKLKAGALADDADACNAAAEELEKIGSRVVPALFDLLRDPNEKVQLRAYDALLHKGERYGNPSSMYDGALPTLIGALGDENWDVRYVACQILGDQGSAAKMAIPALTEVIRDQNASVRGAAASALGDIGPEARSAIPALRCLLRDEFWGIRMRAIDTLLELNGISIGEACVVLIEIVDSDNSSGRDTAAMRINELLNISSPFPRDWTWATYRIAVVEKLENIDAQAAAKLSPRASESTTHPKEGAAGSRGKAQVQ